MAGGRLAKRVRFAGFEADLESGELFRSGERVPLQRRPFSLLAALVERAGALVTRDELRARLWPDGTVVDFEHGLNTAVRKLRRALGDSPEHPRYLETLAGRGYRLLAPVEHVEEHPDASQQVFVAAAFDLEPGELRDALMATLLETALALGAGQVEDAPGEITAAFAGVGAAVYGARELRRRAIGTARPVRLRIGVEVDEHGEGVALARRLRDAAAPDEILVGPRLARALESSADLRIRDRPPVALDGDRELVAFDLDPVGSPALSTLARPPFVGRDAELRRLDHRLAAAREGKAGVVFVAGEPGIGKTRLLEEFAALARRRGASVLAGRCTQSEAAPPYGAIADALSSHVRGADIESLVGLLDPATAAVVARIAPALRERLPCLPQPPALRPDEEGHRLRDAIAQTIAALAKHTLVVLQVDDLHWGDAATLGMLALLARSARGTPVLIVLAYRDVEVDRAHPLHGLREQLGGDGGSEEIELAGLGAESVQALLETASAGGVAPAFVEAVHRASNGNPLFLRELLLAWAREQRLARAANASLTIDVLPLPSSLRAFVAQRVEKLSEDAQRLLTTASGFRGVFHFEATARVAGLAEDAGLDALDEAFEAHLVRSAGGADDYDFSHALIRQTLYEGLTPARRSRVHRRLAEELVRESASDGQPRAAAIAEQYHASRALPGADAGVAHALAAAEQAELATDFEKTARMLQVALDLCPAGDSRRARLSGRCALALAWSGGKGAEVARIAAAAGEAIAASEGDDAAAGFLADAADAIWARDSDPQAWRLAAQGLRHVGARRDDTWMRLATHELLASEAADPEFPGVPRDTPLRRDVFAGFLLHRKRLAPLDHNECWRSVIFDSRAEVLARAGDLPSLLTFCAGELRRGLAGYRELEREPLLRYRLASAATYFLQRSGPEVALGDFEAADRSLQQAFSTLRGVDVGAYVHLAVGLAEGCAAWTRGTGVEDAAARLDAAIRQPSAMGILVVGPATALAGSLEALAGRADAAAARLDTMFRAAAILPGWAPNYTLLVCATADTLWRLGHAQGSPELEAQLRAKTLAPDFRYPNVDARRALAQLCALQGRFREAARWFAESRAVLDEQGARPLRAIVDFDEAWMCARRGARGDRKRALALLDAATARFEAAGMPGWLRRAEALHRDDALTA